MRDWHALRTTFVTLALSAGVPVELVKRVTGHQTTAIAIENYFRPDREQFRAALTGAMPEVLTGKAEKLKPEMLKSDAKGKKKGAKKAGDEMLVLAGKVAAGVATEKEMARFKKLAAEV